MLCQKLHEQINILGNTQSQQGVQLCVVTLISMSNTKPKWTSRRNLKENNSKKCQAHHTLFLPVLPAETCVFHFRAQFYPSKPTCNSRLDLHTHHHRFTGRGVEMQKSTISFSAWQPRYLRSDLKGKAVLFHSLQPKTEVTPSNKGKPVWQNTKEHLPANFEANAKS